MMPNSSWQKINDFQSIYEFNEFVNWIENQIKIGDATEIPVESPYAMSPLFKEKWITNLSNNEVWRLVWPDGPFKGLFDKV